MSFDPICGSHKIFGSFGIIELSEHLGCDFFLLVRGLIDGIAAQRRQRIGSKRYEIRDGQAPRDIANMRIQAAVLMDDQYGRQLAGGVGGPDQVALYRSISLR